MGRQASSCAVISPRKLSAELYSCYPENRKKEEEEKMPLVISVLASVLSRNLDQSKSRRRGRRLGVLDDEAPDISMSIQSYLERIFKYTRVGPPVYVVAYVYIDRLSRKLRINPSNVHSLVITSIMLASKYVEDMNYRNSYFAKVGGFTTHELNKLELEFLFLMDFKLHVNLTVFHTYCTHLQREVSIGGGYQIERALRCSAHQINITHTLQHDQFPTTIGAL